MGKIMFHSPQMTQVVSNFTGDLGLVCKLRSSRYMIFKFNLLFIVGPTPFPTYDRRGCLLKEATILRPQHHQ